MDLFLYRTAYLPFGTYGMLQVPDGFDCLTVGQPWRGNAPFVSCVPNGVYDLVPHAGSKGKGIYALVNKDLGVFHQPGDRENDDQRFACLLGDKANHPDQLQGCEAVGQRYMYYDPDGTGKKYQTALSITNSGKTQAKLFNILHRGRHDMRLIIAPWAGIEHGHQGTHW